MEGHRGVQRLGSAADVVVHDAAAEEPTERERLDRIAHELRAALTPLKGFLTMLAEDRIDPKGADRAEMYDILLRQAGRLEQLAYELSKQAASEADRRPMIVIDGETTTG